MPKPDSNPPDAQKIVIAVAVLATLAAVGYFVLAADDRPERALETSADPESLAQSGAGGGAVGGGGGGADGTRDDRSASARAQRRRTDAGAGVAPPGVARPQTAQEHAWATMPPYSPEPPELPFGARPSSEDRDYPPAPDLETRLAQMEPPTPEQRVQRAHFFRNLLNARIEQLEGQLAQAEEAGDEARADHYRRQLERLRVQQPDADRYVREAEAEAPDQSSD